METKQLLNSGKDQEVSSSGRSQSEPDSKGTIPAATKDSKKTGREGTDAGEEKKHSPKKRPGRGLF